MHPNTEPVSDPTTAQTTTGRRSPRATPPGLYAAADSNKSFKVTFIFNNYNHNNTTTVTALGHLLPPLHEGFGPPPARLLLPTSSTKVLASVTTSSRLLQCQRGSGPLLTNLNGTSHLLLLLLLILPLLPQRGCGLIICLLTTLAATSLTVVPRKATDTPVVSQLLLLSSITRPRPHNTTTTIIIRISSRITSSNYRITSSGNINYNLIAIISFLTSNSRTSGTAWRVQALEDH